jgi:electron transfer flavoprotein alpha subunit
MSSNVIMVFSENPVLLQELINGARQQAIALGWRVAVVGLGKDVSALANLGEDVLFHIDIDARNPELVTSALEMAIAQTKPSVFLVGATKLGLEVAPRMAERIGAGYAAWMVSFDVDVRANGAVTTAQSMVYAGAGIATYKFKPGIVVLSVASGAFESGLAERKIADIVALDPQILAPKVTIQGYNPKPTVRTSLGEARLVIDVGQGVKQREDLQMIQALAELLDGQLACSRPIASDRDWFPEWVGLSGAKIKPELCLTVGVSGAIQHILGIRDSRLIAAVNIDEGAPIFYQADYGVVADLYEFLPALMERVKARRIRPAWTP